MKTRTAKIFAVVTMLVAMCSSAFATGPYLGTAYKTTNYGNGSEVVEISGEKSDVMVELMQRKYDYIMQGKLQSVYFYTDDTNAVAKLFLVRKPTGLFKLYEFCGSKEKALEKEEFLKSTGFEVNIMDDNNLSETTLMADKKVL